MRFISKHRSISDFFLSFLTWFCHFLTFVSFVVIFCIWRSFRGLFRKNFCTWRFFLFIFPSIFCPSGSSQSWVWPHLSEFRQFLSQCTRVLLRGRGSKNKTAKLKFQDVAQGAELLEGETLLALRWPFHSYVVANRCFFRELEVLRVKLAHATVLEDKLSATLFLPASKSDAGGHGVERKLRCSCVDDGGDTSCSVHVLKLQVEAVTKASRIFTASTLPCCGQFGAVQGSSGRGMAAAGADEHGAGWTLCPQVRGQALRKGGMASHSH